ncbi:MAG TPA: hypothetical protein VLS93_04045 [Anaeromyxobacteraceae bacterium]|nr:hypothetical protein [Anaeromyxobacteraceae bacterium]
MIRISIPLAILLAGVIAIVARKPRLFLPLLVVFTIWALWQMSASRRRR